MDQYDSRSPHDRRGAEGLTPIYDRLLAEWQATRGDPEPDPPRAGGLVPAARTSGEALRG
ncbi:hypothetical protein ACIO3R_18425 [Streptomyces sp. NPDC087428]|uniref:hypothetical protein n=1 Tax=Streptomyces sp. NPDC087428 TaxID=3365788 RepID=UPI0038223C7D